MKKIISCILICIFLLSCFAGCAPEKKSINPDAVFQHLLTDIQYDTGLTDAGEMASVYFPDLPAGATVKMHMSNSGYYPDEVVLITLANASDVEAAKATVNNHLEQVHGQFQRYNPTETPKIDNAVIWSYENYLFVVIAPDASAVNALLERADTFTVVSDAQTNPSTGAATTPSTGAPTTQVPTTVTPTTVPPTTVPPTTAPPATVPPTTEATTPVVTEPVVTEPQPVVPPVVEDDPLAGYPSTNTPDGQIPVLTSKSGTFHVYGDGVVRVDNAAFEPYSYDPYAAATYARLVSKVADGLAGVSNVYCMPIPTAVSVTFPDDLRDKYTKSCDQGPIIDQLFTQMSGNVIGINCHNNLMLHRDEYLYFRTDYHWNGPAAYYAYETFCQAKGFTPYTMEQRQVSYFKNFLGYLYYFNSGGDYNLGATPDVVVAYHPYSKSATMKYRNVSGYTFDYPIIQDVSGWPANSKYLCFAAADQPYAEFHNPEVTDGSVLVLVKESYGNVLLSYFVDHYSTIYEIDYRYWTGNLVSFAQSVGANDVLFANNMTMISSSYLLGMLSSIIP